PCRSNHSICSASSSQFRATSSNALFMDRLLVCAARFLASAAFCRYSSDRDDIQGEHWKSVPQITEPCDKCDVGQLAMSGPPAGRYQAPAGGSPKPRGFGAPPKISAK